MPYPLAIPPKSAKSNNSSTPKKYSEKGALSLNVKVTTSAHEDVLVYSGSSSDMEDVLSFQLSNNLLSEVKKRVNSVKCYLYTSGNFYDPGLDPHIGLSH